MTPLEHIRRKDAPDNSEQHPPGQGKRLVPGELPADKTFCHFMSAHGSGQQFHQIGDWVS